MPPNTPSGKKNKRHNSLTMAARKIHIGLPPEKQKTLIGIACNENDYRVGWEVNRLLSLQLARTDNLTIHKTRQVVNEFSQYFYNDEANERAYYLIQNKGTKGHLLPDCKNIDFLFIVSGTLSRENEKQILDCLRTSSLLQGIFSLDAGKINHLPLPY